MVLKSQRPPRPEFIIKPFSKKKLEKCNSCQKFKAHIGFSFNRWLCRQCQRTGHLQAYATNAPLRRKKIDKEEKEESLPKVGHTPIIKYKAEKKALERLKRHARKTAGKQEKQINVCYLTWEESKLIWKECMKRGLNYYQAKQRIREIKQQLRKAYLNTKDNHESVRDSKSILPIK